MSDARGYYQISKVFEFSAAHHLPFVPDGHPCKRHHGHNYCVILTLSAVALDDKGFVMDYGEMKDTFGKWIQDNLDHQDLNVVLMPNPTAELLAEQLYEVAWAHLSGPMNQNQMSVVSVEVCETLGTSAVFYGTK